MHIGDTLRVLGDKYVIDTLDVGNGRMLLRNVQTGKEREAVLSPTRDSVFFRDEYLRVFHPQPTNGEHAYLVAMPLGFRPGTRESRFDILAACTSREAARAAARLLGGSDE